MVVRREDRKGDESAFSNSVQSMTNKRCKRNVWKGAIMVVVSLTYALKLLPQRDAVFKNAIVDRKDGLTTMWKKLGGKKQLRKDLNTFCPLAMSNDCNVNFADFNSFRGTPASTLTIKSKSWYWFWEVEIDVIHYYDFDPVH